MARWLVARCSRRTFAGLAVGGISAASGSPRASAKKCGFCQKNKRGRCKSNKGKNGVFCAPDRVCRNGRCVTFDQTCPANANNCNQLVACGPRDDNYDCECYLRINGGSACATSINCLDVACTSDLGCPSGQVCIGSCADCASGTACAQPCRPHL
jgi:hypothetical protein